MSSVNIQSLQAQAALASGMVSGSALTPDIPEGTPSFDSVLAAAQAQMPTSTGAQLPTKNLDRVAVLQQAIQEALSKNKITPEQKQSFLTIVDRLKTQQQSGKPEFPPELAVLFSDGSDIQPNLDSQSDSNGLYIFSDPYFLSNEELQLGKLEAKFKLLKTQGKLSQEQITKIQDSLKNKEEYISMIGTLRGAVGSAPSTTPAINLPESSISSLPTAQEEDDQPTDDSSASAQRDEDVELDYTLNTLPPAVSSSTDTETFTVN